MSSNLGGAPVGAVTGRLSNRRLIRHGGRALHGLRGIPRPRVLGLRSERSVSSTAPAPPPPPRRDAGARQGDAPAGDYHHARPRPGYKYARLPPPAPHPPFPPPSTSAMRTSHLALLAGAAVASATPLSFNNELSFDALGNMVWGPAQTVSKAANKAWNKVPSLGRPDFDAAKAGAVHTTEELADIMARIGAQMQASRKDLKPSAQKNFLSMASHLNQAHKVDSGFILEEKTTVGNVVYDKIVHPLFPDYALRITSDSKGVDNLPLETQQAAFEAAGGGAFCDPDVKSVSGYLDVSESRHLWFIFFESRNKPGSDPLVVRAAPFSPRHTFARLTHSC